ncbi:bifunctional adenosylcobinamide kinase/adenosylcobinamide-phosphate guanylyltransferase [Paenibacillus alkaliterrae]|uniref:bifunctional adenosylcobinamide kinase/adenosylcobinamide-phosphate guanylyltransferase n=1 Tax=Paenibacillus alkaliterrae TaxID=320909 RepID=UPI001F17BB0F|nr:bifunctional adenosylcobinamide kinase/adenosylcobinamide-phosphate guanylyltransferase [Paenibacillus alkaliterrae]MCF2937114.1 bifunctional adenosylcobinamide kinase/adenosylcobinamide-phosphate guanylyltransferase [Paenibacillus alkaliterrae]
MAILVTGGARSGKSAFAEQYAKRTGANGIYIATCQSYDEEMNERIGKHRRDRVDSGFAWETVEEPYQAADRLARLERQFTVNAENGLKPPAVLLDCLTLWLTNWMLRIDQQSLGDSRLEAETLKLLAAIQAFPYTLLVVTNEVGDGIVPSYPLGRQFRDEAGRLNQRVAAICGRVFLVTAGIPVELKSRAFRWDQL